MTSHRTWICTVVCLLAFLQLAWAETASITVDPTRPGAAISPLLYGNNIRSMRGSGPAILDLQTLEWQPRVLEAIGGLRPTILRFPGGNDAEKYDWQRGIGPQPREPEYRFGTDEWMRLCAEVGAVPIITTNWTNGSPADAASWVEYCNGSGQTPFGAQRAANGNPQPFGVQYWEIGNEATHTTQVRDYAQTLGDYAGAMKKVDPTIRIGAAAWQSRGWMNHYRLDSVPWTETLLKMAGEHLDFLILHTYLWIPEKPEMNDQNIEAAMAYPEHLDRWLAESRAMCAEAGFPDLPLFITEYNGYYGEKGMSNVLQQHVNAVIQCQTLHSFIDAGVEVANFWGLVTYGWDKFATIRFADGKHFALRPTYHALKLYRDQVHGRRLSADVTASAYDTSKLGVVPAQQAVPSLDVVAVLRDDDAVAVGCVWRRTHEPVEVTLTVDTRRAERATVHALVADGPLADNTRVESYEATITDGKVDFTLPPISAAVVVIH